MSKQSEPLAKQIGQVLTTTSYSRFKPVDGNRNKNLLHINRLKKSMSENYLFTVIIVNEKYEIILILLIAVFGFTSVTIHYEAIRGLAVLCYLLIYFFSFFVLDRQKSKTAIKVLFKKNENSTTSS